MIRTILATMPLLLGFACPQTAHAYNYLLFAEADSATFDSVDYPSLRKTYYADVNWAEGDTTHWVGAAPTGDRLPPVFWDTSSTLRFSRGATTSDTTAALQTTAVSNAVTAWDNSGGTYLELTTWVSGGWTLDIDDNRNVVSFGTWTDLGSTIGRTFHRIDASAGDEGEILESDIILNDKYKWTHGTFEFGSTINPVNSVSKDMQSVIAHELGHAVGLAHHEEDLTCSDELATMMSSGFACNDSTCKDSIEALGRRTLSPDDDEAINEMYGPGKTGGDQYTIASECGGGEGAKPVAVARRSDGSLACHPNPVNPGTTIGFRVERTGPVSLRVYNLSGQVADELFEGRWFPRGDHAIQWDGGGAASGVYLLELSGQGWSRRGKVTLLR